MHIICDVERYPQFVPGCTSAQMLSNRPIEVSGESAQEWEAELTLSARDLTQRLHTRNVQTANKLVMSLVSGSGLLQALEGTWQVEPLAGKSGSRVWLELHIKTSGLMAKATLKALGKPAIEAAAKRIIRAFDDEAARRYGGTGNAV